MRAAQARSIIGSRMREAREASQVSLSEAARRAGWDKGHLSRVERGSTKPSRDLVGWYDQAFGTGGTLLRQLVELETAVRSDRERTLRDARRHDLVGLGTGAAAGRTGPTVAAGSTPVDYDPDDHAELVAETVADGTLMRAGRGFQKTWTMRNRGPVPWVGRWLTRQGSPGVAGWLSSPARVPIPDTRPGELVTIGLELCCPPVDGACVAYFKMTDAYGRLYYPGTDTSPLYCTVIVTDEASLRL